MYTIAHHFFIESNKKDGPKLHAYFNTPCAVARSDVDLKLILQEESKDEFEYEVKDEIKCVLVKDENKDEYKDDHKYEDTVENKDVVKYKVKNEDHSGGEGHINPKFCENMGAGVTHALIKLHRALGVAGAGQTF